ncbi:Efflux transporter, RND family, MFP subunit [Cyclobacterium amurskyense]|uniref:Efflux transporter, RND family, MFP subunit n=2 Tax=Cyclobacterium amurskyense TaxID=320787 RepID=A0A0H4P8K5_9BACT|nr:efflux RND transporter periplasmic adaptor subunit [Cyclobacterium amurskyense]AKP50821.1 Efflux transporter, RND family, MFP subunit [Cyclobacterium amurskyense]
MNKGKTGLVLNMSRIKLNKIGIYAFFIPLIVVFSCNSGDKSGKKAEAVKEFPVIEVVASDTIMHRDYVADIKAIQNVELRARVQGFLEKVNVDEGQEVKKGQILFKTNEQEYKAELAKAKANFESAKAEAKVIEFEVGRLKIMVDNNVISESELNLTKAKYDAVLAKIEEAKSAMDNAEVQLSYTNIRAPFDGIIDRIPLKTGSLVEQGSLFTTVSNISSVHVYFNVSEKEYLEYIKSKGETTENNVVNLVLADGAPYAYEGIIETMQGEFNANTGSIAFRALFPNPTKILKHGATGKIILTNKIRNAIIIPQKAVFEIQDRSFVYIVKEDNTVEMRSIIPRARFSHYYIIESGLEVGERLVYEGIQNVKDGMTIQPKIVADETGSTLPENDDTLAEVMPTSTEQ